MMKKINNVLDFIKDRLFSSTYQLQRIVIWTAIALGLALISFSSYYYYDRYYQPQPKSADVMLEEAKKAVRDNPDNPEIRLNLAETYMFTREFDEAIELAEQVREAYPDNQRSWLIIGVAHALKGTPEKAIEPLEKYLEANKDSEMPGLNSQLQSAAYYLGDSYLQLNRPESAIPSLELAVEWSQTDADSMYKLGVAYHQVKEYNKALVILHNATTYVPNFTEAYEEMVLIFEETNDAGLADYARGMVAYTKQDYQTAKTLLLKSIQETPNAAPTYSGLGMTNEAMNDLENAKASYETALQLDPNDFTAAEGLKRVEILLQK